MEKIEKEILYFYTTYSPFVEKDIAILKKKFRIKVFLLEIKNKYLALFLFSKHFFFLLFNIFKADVVICQFAGYHSFLPVLLSKLFLKPSLIITGGTDCVSFPSIHYGNFSKKFLSIVTKWSYSLASHISPVHESLIYSEYNYCNDDYPQQGILAFCQNLKTPYTVINNGYDSNKWHRTKIKKDNTFISVASWLQLPFRSELKGIDLIIEIAPFFPESKFVIVGLLEGYSIPVKSSNIQFLPFIKDNEVMNDIYSESRFCIQVSLSEGFPNALCEAMLCECIPIVSNVGAMPDIIGNTGYILQKKDIHSFREIISNAIRLENKNEKGIQARARIRDLFSEEKRKDELLKLVCNLTSKVK